ncbi:MAG TPA: sugar ABC transporter ATP-binding protein, partial [Polyangiaceae bacterium]
GELSISQQQLVQIASAVGTGAKVIVFDEPTSSLSQSEAEDIVALCGRLRARGVTVLYVTHRVEEIFKLCDAVTVLRDGRHVLTSPTGELDEPALVRAMIGRTLESHSPRYLERPPGEELLRVENLFSPRKFRHISFSIHAGEVLGMAGLIGAGRTEIARAIFGLDAAATGRVFLRGQPMVFKQPASAMQAGIGLVPEDRKRHGLVLGLSCKENLSLPMLNTRGLSRAGFVRLSAESALVQRYFERFRVKTPHPNFVVAGLSGGNQQKIVLAKWLAAECRLLLLDEPTRGIDVGAKAEIHEFVDQLVQRGAGVLLISSELPEVLKLSRRILVLCRGQIADELSRDQATQESILRLMSAQPA